MSSSKGGREIQLAKERLLSAKARLESASKNFDTAELELLSSQSEVKKAIESLQAIEKRRGIDSDSEEEGNNKKRKKGNTKSPTPAAMKECDRILSKLKRVDKTETGDIFSVPINEDDNDAPDYFNIISEPCDFGTIQARLDANEIDVPEFHRLVLLVFTNAITYNADEDHFVHQAALKLQHIYHKEKSRSLTRDNSFAVGQSVLAWCDKTNDHWKATILGRKEKNGIPGYNIHWKGERQKEKGKEDWASSDDITADNGEFEDEFGNYDEFKISCIDA